MKWGVCKKNKSIYNTWSLDATIFTDIKGGFYDRYELIENMNGTERLQNADVIA